MMNPAINPSEFAQKQIQIEKKRVAAYAMNMEMCPRHAYLDDQEYEPIGFVSVYQRGQIETINEAQLQEYRDACGKDAEEREAEHSDSERVTTNTTQNN